MHAPVPASSAVEDYLKAVYALETRLEGPVPTNALAARLGVTPGSVSGMLRRLDELGLLEHERYRGVTLTAEGRRKAKRVEQVRADLMKLATELVGDRDFAPALDLMRDLLRFTAFADLVERRRRLEKSD